MSKMEKSNMDIKELRKILALLRNAEKEYNYILRTTDNKLYLGNEDGSKFIKMERNTQDFYTNFEIGHKYFLYQAVGVIQGMIAISRFDTFVAERDAEEEKVYIGTPKGKFKKYAVRKKTNRKKGERK